MVKRTTSFNKPVPSQIVWVLLAVSSIFIALFLYGKYFYAAAKVNGVRITRTQYLQELEKLDRNRVLDGMINRALVYQEAKKRKINVTQKEIDAQITLLEKEFKKQKKTLTQGLNEQNISVDIVTERIRFNKTLEKLIVADVKISEKEIDDFIGKNAAVFAQQPLTQQIRNRVKEYLHKQKVRQKTKDLLSSLRKKADIQYSAQ